MSNLLWKSDLEIPPISSDQLHLFRVNLSEAFLRFDLEDHSHLSPREVHRCSRYRFRKDKIRFSVGRLVLRRLFKNYLSAYANPFDFVFNEFGKPSLLYYPELKFNLSHSGDYILIGVGKEYELGVDTEVYNETIDHLDLAKSVFSLEEQSALSHLPIGERIHGFYRCWSMKESVIKAVGIGLQLPLDQFSVDLSNDQKENRLLSMSWKPELKNTIKTKVINIDSGYCAAYTCHPSISDICYVDLVV